MSETTKVKPSPAMKEVILKMRKKGKTPCLFWNYGYRGAYLDQEPLNNKTFDALYQRGLITMVVNVAAFARYELTALGKSITI